MTTLIILATMLLIGAVIIACNEDEPACILILILAILSGILFGMVLEMANPTKFKDETNHYIVDPETGKTSLVPNN